MIVVDASALIAALIPEPDGNRVRRRIASAGATLHAPELIDLEIAQTLRRKERDGLLGETGTRALFARLRATRLARYPHTPFLSRIWELRSNLSAYDASYVALAEALDAPLLTLDRRLAAAPGVGANVEVVS